MSRFTTFLFRRVGGTWEPQLMHRFTEITSAIPLPSIQKGEQPLNKKALRGLFFIYYISPKVGSPESRTQQLVRSRFWLAPFYYISKALTSKKTDALTRNGFIAGGGLRKLQDLNDACLLKQAWRAQTGSSP